MTKKSSEVNGTSQMCGPLWSKGELCFFFSPKGTAKSIFSIQIADALSKGEDVIPNILANECDPQRVLYFDLTWGNQSFKSINFKDYYTNHITNKKYEFSENLFFATINSGLLHKGIALDELIEQEIERARLNIKPSVLIIENILVHEHEYNINKLAKTLINYKRKYGLSILITTHTTKWAETWKPLNDANLSTATSFKNLSDSVFGLKPNALGENLTYLKPFKIRNRKKTYTEGHVMVLDIEKGGRNHNFLRYKIKGISSEQSQLSTPPLIAS